MTGAHIERQYQYKARLVRTRNEDGGQETTGHTLNGQVVGARSRERQTKT